jgi:NAD(P)-dependent dehydrogenase (short-subunit alcohol dehydrogenase family)
MKRGTAKAGMRPLQYSHNTAGVSKWPSRGTIATMTSSSARSERTGSAAASATSGCEEGADVAITWLDNEPAAESVAARIRKAGRRAHLIRADVARLADIEAMVTDTVRVLGAADIRINNAGVYPRVKLLEMREADWDYVLDVNLKGRV